MERYYEWCGSKDNKQPFYITDRNVGCIVSAGLYAENEHGLSCTILTKPANKELSHIHPRMPLMLTSELAGTWLTGEFKKDDLLSLDSP